MSYYQYMVSVYRSCLPQLNRTLRSSSVTRTSPEREPAPTPRTPARFERAATVGPCSSSYDYVSAMPFTYQYNLASERYNDTRNRLAAARSITPVRTYQRAFSTTSNTSSSTGYSSYDYKVMDYASRLDREEETREYINSRQSRLDQHQARSTSYDLYSGMRNRYQRDSASPFKERYNRYDSMKHERDYMYDTYDVGANFKHYRLSNQTLNLRNARAKSPVQSRELDRYYKTEKRTSFIGEVSSGANRDFRYYSYRPVPYFGGSDQYQMTKRRQRR